MMETRTVLFRSGATRDVPALLSFPILGLDADGRVVVDMDGYAFGLTRCCNAFDKGVEHGTVCRACYGSHPNADEGRYDPDVVDPLAADEDAAAIPARERNAR